MALQRAYWHAMRAELVWVMAAFWGSAACSSSPGEVEQRCEIFCAHAERGSVCDLVGIVESCRNGR